MGGLVDFTVPYKRSRKMIDFYFRNVLQEELPCLAEWCDYDNSRFVGKNDIISTYDITVSGRHNCDVLDVYFENSIPKRSDREFVYDRFFSSHNRINPTRPRKQFYYFPLIHTNYRDQFTLREVREIFL